MPQGFIHDELDVKLLVLYIMSRVAGPLDFAALTDLTLCDSGVDYFIFAQAVPSLVESGHLMLDQGLYTITDKGRENSATLESGLPSVIRKRCDKTVAQYNAVLRRSAQVVAQVTDEDDHCVVELALADGAGDLMRLALTSPTRKLADLIARNFKAQPEVVFNSLLSLLLTPSEEEEEKE